MRVEQARVHGLKDVSALLDLFQSHGHNEVDTARVYGQGSSEELIAYDASLPEQSPSCTQVALNSRTPTLRTPR
ncbi:hypothetical protein V1517DRAFT_331312 [Lipomyces orientalis]|uniref:Uncharacterized protein n=1 Tax=Lipomyces orientalis TaxID=1233043 RepID=A0ACC3TGM1_9ASCO